MTEITELFRRFENLTEKIKKEIEKYNLEEAGKLIEERGEVVKKIIEYLEKHKDNRKIKSFAKSMMQSALEKNKKLKEFLEEKRKIAGEVLKDLSSLRKIMKYSR